MRLVICPNDEVMSEKAAEHVRRRMEEHKKQDKADRPFVLGLPTGGTVEKLYRNLVRAHREGSLSFRDAVTFNMDEYVGLPEEHPQSYHYFMHEHLFRHIDIKKENIHILDGNKKNPEEECLRYEEKIREIGGIRLFLGGIGVDGHLAFNEPGSSLRSRTRPVLLTEDTRRQNSRFFDHDIEQVPRRALTVGVGTVTDADEVMILASGEKKAPALKQIVEGAVSHMWTASVLQMHPRAVIFCDEEAVGDLSVKTVRYFRSIEAAENSSFH